jgi:hypothetical protein
MIKSRRMRWAGHVARMGEKMDQDAFLWNKMVVNVDTTGYTLCCIHQSTATCEVFGPRSTKRHCKTYAAVALQRGRWVITWPLRYQRSNRTGQRWELVTKHNEKTLLICWNTCSRMEMFTNISKRWGPCFQHFYVHTPRQALFASVLPTLRKHT